MSSAMPLNSSDLQSINPIEELREALQRYISSRENLPEYSGILGGLGRYVPYAFSKREKLWTAKRLLDLVKGSAFYMDPFNDRARKVLFSGNLKNDVYLLHRQIIDTILKMLDETETIENDNAKLIIRLEFLDLLSAGFSYNGNSKKLYDDLINIPHCAYDLARWFKALKEAGIPYDDEYEALYHIFTKKILCSDNLDWLRFLSVDELAKCCKVLKEADIPYNEKSKNLYRQLINDLTCAQKPMKLSELFGLVNCFKILKEAGFSYNTHFCHYDKLKNVYESFLDYSGCADKIALGVKTLKEAGFPCVIKFEYLYVWLIDSVGFLGHDVDKLGLGLKELKEVGSLYEESKYLYDALIKALKDAGFPYDEF